MTSRVKVHTKVLTSPDLSLTTVFQNMREVNATVNIDIEWATEETLNLPALNVVDVGQCIQGQTTSEQNQLFINRNFAGANDIVVYFVLATDPPFNGCAAHPLGTPSAVVARPATQWTFAHEISHVLDLIHVNNNDLLITGNGTTNITNPPPELVASEVATMQATVLTVDVNNDDHILAKLQTQGNSGFMRCSQQMVPGVSHWPELRGRRSAAS